MFDDTMLNKNSLIHRMFNVCGMLTEIKLGLIFCVLLNTIKSLHQSSLEVCVILGLKLMSYCKGLLDLKMLAVSCFLWENFSLVVRTVALHVSTHFSNGGVLF